MSAKPYKRVLLKLSGEALLGDQDYGIDYKACQEIAQTIKEIRNKGIEIAIVIGGGNIFRGSHATQFGFERTPADHIGILATCINGLALHQVFHAIGVKTRVMSSRNFDDIIEPYNWSQAQSYLEDGVIVIFVGGTGNPYFTTDTAAALRASEMGAEVLLKATKVDGVYDKDPTTHKNAKRFDCLSYEQVLSLDLKVMDAPAVAMCRDNHIEIRVVELFSRKALLEAVMERKGGTLICNKAHKEVQSEKVKTRKVKS